MQGSGDSEGKLTAYLKKKKKSKFRALHHPPFQLQPPFYPFALAELNIPFVVGRITLLPRCLHPLTGTL